MTFAEPRDSHAAGIRVIHQEPEIVPNLTVAENIFVGEMPRRLGVLLDWRTLEEQTNAVLADFGMQRDLRARQLCATLGPAQRQMIEIMRAVRAGGRLIAFDEPTSSLTDDEARRLFAVIRRLRADGASIVYISHRLNEIIELADRIVVLRDGRLVDDRRRPAHRAGDRQADGRARRRRPVHAAKQRAQADAVLEVERPDDRRCTTSA